MAHNNLTEITADIVCSYVGTNRVSADELPGLIQMTYAALDAVASGTARSAEPEHLTPAVPLKKAVHPDYIVCLEDGRQLKTLKRYLRTRYNLTPEEYRARWGLPSDSPMVAPNYAAKRSAMAKNIGLGAKLRPAPRLEPAPAPAAKAARKPRAKSAGQ